LKKEAYDVNDTVQGGGITMGFGSYGGYGYGGYGYGGYGGGFGSTFVLIVVLFILLIIVGAAFVG
jgi:uncharacterized protein (TIGR01732 family)